MIIMMKMLITMLILNVYKPGEGGLGDNDNNDDGNNNDGDNHDKRSKARGTFEVRSLKKTPHLYWFLQIVM